MRSRMEDQMRSGGQQQRGQNPFGGHQRAQYSDAKQQKEGDVKIFTTSESSEKRVSKDVGDYVDFEEIKK